MGQRVLLIIAPDMYQCCKTAEHWGFVIGQIENFRNITRALQLRGTRPGTPFITFGREFWADTPMGFNLDQAVTTLQRTGHLRIAQDDDIRAHTSFADVPFRSPNRDAVREIVAKYARAPL